MAIRENEKMFFVSFLLLTLKAVHPVIWKANLANIYSKVIIFLFSLLFIYLFLNLIVIQYIILGHFGTVSHQLSNLKSES